MSYTEVQDLFKDISDITRKLKDKNEACQRQIAHSPFQNIIISHETHRGRCLYHPAIALDVVQSFPELKLTLDMSHWAVVTERLVEGGWFDADPGIYLRNDEI